MSSKFDRKDWQLFCEIARSEPNKEHTELLSVEQAAASPLYVTYKYGTQPPAEARGCTLMTFRNKDGELMVTKTKQRTHQMVVAASGAGKTQGCILNEALNMDGKTSYIFTDPKGEVTARAYSYAVQKYGKENVIIVNYMQPQYSHVKINPLAALARKWLKAESEPESVKRLLRDMIATEIAKFLDVTCVVKSVKDPTWEETARNFIFAIIMGLFEDLTLTPEEEKRTKRSRTYPEQITFTTVSRIFYSFDWDRKLDDNGFLSARNPESRAYQNSKSIINNAPNTRANYMQFVENYLRPLTEPKIRIMCEDDTFDIESMAKTPKVLFLIYDLSDINVREWVNNIIANSLQSLLAYSHRTAKPFDVPVVFVCDEFPTLKPHKIYPTLLETGRGSNLFMLVSVQSISQVQARYPEDYTSMLENCGVRMFLGTNDTETARHFIANMGKTTVPSATAFLAGRYSSELIDVVSVDALMHRMQNGESYICIDRNMPIHGNFELYYRTDEYARYPITPNNSHGALFEREPVPEFDAPWLHKKDGDDDDDDFFNMTSRSRVRREEAQDPKKDEDIIDGSAAELQLDTRRVRITGKRRDMRLYEYVVAWRILNVTPWRLYKMLKDPPADDETELTPFRALHASRVLTRLGLSVCLIDKDGNVSPVDPEVHPVLLPSYAVDDLITSAILFGGARTIAATVEMLEVQRAEAQALNQGGTVSMYNAAISRASAYSEKDFKALCDQILSYISE